jgi:hypothetical protein
MGSEEQAELAGQENHRLLMEPQQLMQSVDRLAPQRQDLQIEEMAAAEGLQRQTHPAGQAVPASL